MRRSLLLLVAATLLACPKAPTEPAPTPPSVAAAPGPVPSSDDALRGLPPPGATDAAAGPAFVCTTNRYRVAVSQTGSTTRYRAWTADAPFDSPPDLELTGAPPTVEGSCGVQLWSFTNGRHSYAVRQGRCDADGNPLRPGALGLLTVATEGEALLRQSCGPAGAIGQGGWTIAYRPGQATATPDGGTARLLYVDREDQGADGSESREWHTPLSVVGPYISVQHEWYGEGGAHPTYGTTWSVLDGRDPNARFNLADFVPEPILLAALLADPTILGALSGPPPATLAALLSALDGGCAMDLGPNLLSQVAFAALDDAGMHVRLGISHGCEAERGTFTTIDLVLPPAPALLDGLQLGQAAGTLMDRLVPRD